MSDILLDSKADLHIGLEFGKLDDVGNGELDLTQTLGDVTALGSLLMRFADEVGYQQVSSDDDMHLDLLSAHLGDFREMDIDLSGIDSGFSSPQDSPTNLWWMDNCFSDLQTPRSRLPSISQLTVGEQLLVLGDVLEPEHSSDDLVGPMVDPGLVSPLCFSAIAHVKSEPADLFNASRDSGIGEAITIEHTASAVVESIPSQVARCGIDPNLLSQYDDDPDGEIDVVGDGDPSPSFSMLASASPFNTHDSTSSSPTNVPSSIASNVATTLASPSELAHAIPMTPIPGAPGMFVGPVPGALHLPGHLGLGNDANGKGRPQPYPKRNSERKRHLHNELERKRREDLNNTFFRLGELLPNLKTGNAAPTQVHILQGAAQRIRELKERQSQLVIQRTSLQSEQARLQQRLRELQAAYAGS